MSDRRYRKLTWAEETALERGESWPHLKPVVRFEGRGLFAELDPNEDALPGDIVLMLKDEAAIFPTTAPGDRDQFHDAWFETLDLLRHWYEKNCDPDLNPRHLHTLEHVLIEMERVTKKKGLTR